VQCPAAKAVYTYTSATTNNTYTLNTEPANATVAEAFCNDVGGHLVSWISREEQVRKGSREPIPSHVLAAARSAVCGRI
jgi:hypothetical protein